MSRWLLVALMLVPGLANAEDRHVDADAACPGDGSAGAPFCELMPGLEAAQPGDRILIHEADGSYPGFTVTEGVASGTSADPIVLEPAPGEAPIIGGALVFNDLSHWTIRGLTIDLREVSASPGIDIRSPNQASVGAEVLDNLVIGSSGPAIRLGLFEDLIARDAVIEGNIVRGGIGSGIQIVRSRDAVVEGNLVEDVTCATGQFKLQSGIVAILDNEGTQIVGNTVRALRECEAGPSGNHVQGIRIRTSVGGSIRDNLVEVEAPNGGNFVGGISIHEESSEWSVHHNVVRVTNGCALCDGADFGLSSDNVWSHNTVVDTDLAIEAVESSNARFEFNLLQASDAAVVLGEPATGMSFERNLVSGSSVVESDGSQSFEAFADGCSCDEGSVVGDALMLAEDGLTPGEGSPALDLASTSEMRASFNGDAPDAGALEALRAVDAVVSSDGGAISVAVENAWAPPLLPDGCAGVELERDGAVTCVVEHDMSSGTSRVEISLASPLAQGEEAVLRVLANATDSTAIGRRVAARVQPASFVLDTSGLPEGGSSSSGTDMSTTDGDASTGDISTPSETEAGGSGGLDDEDGCGCRSADSNAWAWLGLFVLGLRRRRLVV